MEDNPVDDKIIQIGDKVRIKYLNDETLREFIISGNQNNVNVEQDIIYVAAPVGRALRGRHLGDTVAIHVEPNITRQARIECITRPSETNLEALLDRQAAHFDAGTQQAVASLKKDIQQGNSSVAARFKNLWAWAEGDFTCRSLVLSIHQYRLQTESNQTQAGSNDIEEESDWITPVETGPKPVPEPTQPTLQVNEGTVVETHSPNYDPEEALDRKVKWFGPDIKAKVQSIKDDILAGKPRVGERIEQMKRWAEKNTNHWAMVMVRDLQKYREYVENAREQSNPNKSGPKPGRPAEARPYPTPSQAPNPVPRGLGQAGPGAEDVRDGRASQPRPPASQGYANDNQPVGQRRELRDEQRPVGPVGGLTPARDETQAGERRPGGQGPAADTRQPAPRHVSPVAPAPAATPTQASIRDRLLAMTDQEWGAVKLSYPKPFRSEINKEREARKSIARGGTNPASLLKWRPGYTISMSRIKLEGDSLVIDGQSFDARRPLNSSSMLPTPALKRLLQLDPLISEQDRPAYLDLVQRLTERRNEYARRNYHPSLLDQNGELSNAALRDIKTQVGFALRKFVDRLGPWVWGLRGDLMTSALKAAQNWKPEGGAQLKTYLHKPLEGALQDLTNPHLKQLPRALHPLLYKHWGEIMSPSGVTDQELATSLNTTPEAIRQVRDYFRMTRPQAMTQVSEGEEFDTKAVQGYAGDN